MPYTFIHVHTKQYYMCCNVLLSKQKKEEIMTTDVELTPDKLPGLLEAGVLHHTGDLLSSFGGELQVGVDLVVPVSIHHLLAKHHITGHLLAISVPGHTDHLWVEVVRAAHQPSRMTTSGGLPQSQSHLWLNCKI